MQNQLGIDITERLHNQHPGYIQAISNAAYIVVQQSEAMVDEVMSTDDPTRLAEFVEQGRDLALGKELGEQYNKDVMVLDQIADVIVPEICRTYGVVEAIDGSSQQTLDEEVVAEDICLAIDYFSAQLLSGKLFDDF